MNFNKFKYELISTDSGYEVVVYLPDNLEEMSNEFDFTEKKSGNKNKLFKYVENLYPNITIQAIKFVAGSMVVAYIILPAHPQNKTHAKPIEISNNIDINIVMGNYYIKPDAKTFLYNNRAMVSLRSIAEVLGAEVIWDDKSKMAVVKKDNNEIKLWIGNKWAVSNKTEYNMDAEPMIVSGRTMVPIRFIAEAFEIDVQWYEQSKTVIINYDKNYTLDYIVQPGDTLAKISNQFGVSIDNLRLWNKIQGDIIYSGQFLRVASPALETISSSMDDIEIKQYKFDNVLGYTVRDYPSHMSSYNSLNKYNGKLTEVSTFTHKILLDGTLSMEYNQSDVIKLAKDRGLDVVMLVHNADNSGFNKDLVKEVLKNSEKRTKLVESIYNQLKIHGYSGVEIDIENLPVESREDYNNFIIELSEKIKPENYTLACALPAKTSDSGESWLKGYDYKTIGKYADRVLIMAYDQHWAGGSPGPVASIEWVDRVAKYTKDSIHPSKVILGIPMYGYDWPVNGGKGKSVTTSSIKGYLNTYGGKIEWNESSKSPYYKYRDTNGTEHIVWFENPQSTQFKFEIAKKYNFTGVGMWRLGLEDAEFWEGLEIQR